MTIALLSDVHGNLQALHACLADAEARGANRYVFLGDLVGYGADPHGVVDIVRDHVSRGADPPHNQPGRQEKHTGSHRAPQHRQDKHGALANYRECHSAGQWSSLGLAAAEANSLARSRHAGLFRIKRKVDNFPA